MPEVKYQLTVAGAAEAKAAITGVAETAEGFTGKVEKVSGALEKLGPATEGVTKLAGGAVGASQAFTGLASALGSGGLGAVIGVINFVAMGVAQWNKETEEQARLADEAAKKDKTWLEETTRLVKAASAALTGKTAEELKQLAIIDDLRIAHLAEERMALAQSLAGAKGNGEELNRIRKAMSEKATEIAEAQTQREVDWKKYGVAQNRALNMEILVNEREKSAEDKKLSDEQFKRENDDRVKVLDGYKQFLADEKAARDKALADRKAKDDAAAMERFKLFRVDNEMYLQTAQERMKREQEISALGMDTRFKNEDAAMAARVGQGLQLERIALLRKQQAEKDEDDRQRARQERMDAIDKQMAEGNLHLTEEEYSKLETMDDDITAAKIANRQAVTDATVSQLRRQMNEENKAQLMAFATAQAETAKTAAMMVAQPVINEMLGTEREMLMLNRDTFQAYRDQDWKAIIAAKTQAIMAGIAVEATGKAIMEGGEAAAALGAGFGMLALGMPNAAPMFVSAGEHAAAAGIFAGIAGASAGGAVAVGSQRGEGSMFGISTGDNKTGANGSGSTGAASAGRSTGGGFGGSGSAGNGQVITVYNYEAGSVDASDRQQRNRTIQAANRDNARDEFARREMLRSA